MQKYRNIKPGLVTVQLLHSAGQSEAIAADVFARRLQERSGRRVHLCNDPENTSDENSLVIVAGSGGIAGLESDFSSEPEGYRIHIPDETSGSVVVSGSDARGLLYGLGRLLRLFEYGDVLRLPILREESRPAVRERGVYFATHFNNWYESAPIEEVERYVEDLALWGINTFWAWFDMNWFSADFWNDPDSRGMKMISRIRRIHQTAHRLGLSAGLTGIANEGFSHQPSPELRANQSSQRGGFYPYSQICPSQPRGLEMILANRRKVLELIGPIDAFLYWPYDQGSCGCSLCSDENGWGKTFLRIGPSVAGIVRELNPHARLVVSTWMMTDAEIKLVCMEASKQHCWFDSILVETHRAGQLELPIDVPVSVFPDISMFDCYFVSYGCNGANPAPRRFASQAAQIAGHDHGAVLYSEGVYEDLNKIIWAACLWNPEQTPEETVAEYVRYYFGEVNLVAGRQLLFGLEQTWGAKKLAAASNDDVLQLLDTVESMQKAVPRQDWCQWRWEALCYRARLDHRMKSAGSERNLLTEAKELFDEAAYSDDPAGLRQNIISFRSKVSDRLSAINALYQTYENYLRCFHLESSVLVFRPDQFLGNADVRSLFEACDNALQAENDDSMRKAFIKGIHRWLWFNGVGTSFLFL